jgi:hypothetical protein
MGLAYYPTQTVETKLLGTVAVTTATFILLSINGVIYPNGYRVNYSKGYRLFSPSLDSSGNVSIVCVSLAYGEDLPSFSLSNVEVYIIG